MALPDRFWSKVRIDEDNPDGCWYWQAHISTAKRRARFGLNGKAVEAHVLSFIDCGGILTKEKPLVLHKCNVAHCVNPTHLKAGDYSENTKDQVAAGTHNQSRKTHCKRGHELREGNLSIHKLLSGKRICLICDRARVARYKASLVKSLNKEV